MSSSTPSIFKEEVTEIDRFLLLCSEKYANTKMYSNNATLDDFMYRSTNGFHFISNKFVAKQTDHDKDVNRNYFTLQLETHRFSFAYSKKSKMILVSGVIDPNEVDVGSIVCDDFEIPLHHFNEVDLFNYEMKYDWLHFDFQKANLFKLLHQTNFLS